MCKKRCFGKRTSFIIMMFLTTSFFFVEIIVGYITNSMALVADSFHMLSDILSLFIGFFALKYSKKAPGKVDDSNTYGLVRAEVLGALVNAVFLIALCFSILVEALKRLIETDSIKNPDLVLIVGSAGLLINVIGLFMFQGHAGHGHSHGSGGHGHSHDVAGHGHNHGCEKHDEESDTGQESHEDTHGHCHSNGKPNGVVIVPNNAKGFQNKGFRRESDGISYIIATNNEHTTVELNNDTETSDNKHEEDETSKKPKVKDGGQMNMKGVYLHILGDALGSVIVIVAALVVKYFDGKWTDYVDPGMSILIVLIILKTTIPLLRESSKILLQYVPQHIQIKKLEEKMLVTFPEIHNIHEFHVWQLTGSKIIASVHVRIPSNVDYKVFSMALKDFFHQEGIHSTTIQPEFIEGMLAETGKQCLLPCVSNSCEENKCCGESKLKNRRNKKHGSNQGSEESGSKHSSVSCSDDVHVDGIHDPHTDGVTDSHYGHNHHNRHDSSNTSLDISEEDIISENIVVFDMTATNLTEPVKADNKSAVEGENETVKERHDTAF